jgi:hypothetical protein
MVLTILLAPVFWGFGAARGLERGASIAAGGLRGDVLRAMAASSNLAWSQYGSSRLGETGDLHFRGKIYRPSTGTRGILTKARLSPGEEPAVQGL